MAEARPKFKFRAGPGAPKITAASAVEAAQYDKKESQTSDILSLMRGPVAKADPADKPIPTGKVSDEVMFKKKVQGVPVQTAVALGTKVLAASQKKKSTVAKAPEEVPFASLLEPDALIEKISEEVDLTKYDEELQGYAIDILGVEHQNPYKDKTQRPIYPLQSRLGFQDAILKVFSDFVKVPEFGKEPDYDACKKLAAGPQQQLEMYEYQKFIRDYVRQATPYRGVLVYHGLGSGKTCSAIAAAEALFSVTQKKIIVMTPSSLRDNFINEISFCGFRHFRLQNYWVSLDATNPMVKLFGKEVLGLPEEFTRRASQIWVPDFEQPGPNYNTLSNEDRQQIKKQLNTQINSRIQFINYNGITATKLKEIICAPRDANGYGLFDNKVIVIDEIHNLTNLMQGVIEPYLTTIQGLKRKVPLEPIGPEQWEPALCKKATDPKRPALTNYKRGYMLYRLLSTARNSKIIGLSGTPLINFPEELAILMNVVGGYMYTSSFSVSPANEQNIKIVKEFLKSNPSVDFEQVDVQGSTLGILFTLMPEGMVKVEGPEGTAAQKLQPGTPSKTIMQVTAEVIAGLSEKGLKVVRPPEYKGEPILPPVGNEFRENFLTKDGTELNNTIVLRKRIQGLISYYRGSKKELMPQVTKDELIRVPFSPYAQSEYQRVRIEELKAKDEQDKKKKGASGDAKLAGLWADFYEITAMKQSNSYRMSSRQACNFAFPEGITRPRPSNLRDAVAEIGVDKEVIDKVIDGGPSAPEELAVEAEEIGKEEEEAQKEDEEIDEVAKEAALAQAKAEGKEAEAAELEEEGVFLAIKEIPATPEKPMAAVAAAAPVKKTLT
jgi:hypothetical protein